MHVAARQAAQALLARGVTPMRLGAIEVEEYRSRFWGRPKRRVTLKTDRGRGWLLEKGIPGDGESVGSNGVALTTEGELITARVHSLAIDALTDTGEPVVEVYGEPASFSEAALDALAAGDRQPYVELRADRLKRGR